MDGYSKYEKLKIRVLDKKEDKEHFHQDIELGQKPRRIQRNVQDLLVFENGRVQFKDFAHWDKVTDAIFRHIINKYGRDETAGWIVELWYDEPCVQILFEHYNYFELFVRPAKGTIFNRWKPCPIR